MSIAKRRAYITNVGLWLFCLFVPLFLLNNSYVARLNWIVYDAMHGFLTHAASEQVVVVAIDDKSLKHLGRWPWSRAVHTRFLEKVTGEGVKAVGFDILFPENESAEVDYSFAKAIKHSGRVVLAVAPEMDAFGEVASESLPIPVLALAADRLGHVDYELGIDGVCRSVFLYAGLDSAHWPAFSYAVYKTAYGKDSKVDGSVAVGWIRKQSIYIPFLAVPSMITKVSFVDVLNGQEDDTIRDKILLVGATAAGLGDQLSTPISGEHQRMSGVEVSAHALEAMVQERTLEYASISLQVVFTAAVTFLFGLVMYVFGLLRAPFIFFVSVAVVLFSIFLSLQLARLWIPPFASLIGIVVIYFIWGWRSQSIVQVELSTLSQTLQYQGELDPVSSLPSRAMLERNLNQRMLHAKQVGNLVSVYIINPGQLRAINDHLGFKTGDELLNKVASRIQRALGEDAFVAKINGEFSVIQEVANELRIKHVGGRLLQTLQQPVTWEGKDYYLPPSIGVSVFPEDGLSSDMLINHAFTAMHRAKADKKRGLLFFSRQMKADLVKRSELESDLRNALVNKEFEVYYQPKVCAKNHKIKGAEALLRWHHPIRGMIPPSDFIPLAEKQGIIVEIGAWVLREACFQAKQWHAMGFSEFQIAVNVSAVQLTESDFPAVLQDTLAETELAPHLLEIEVTETALMTDVELTIRILEQIKALGTNVAVDDFGTGYSSLNYLNMFPVDSLKIDRVFVKDIGIKSDSKDITSSIIGMAHRLNLKVVAEGVETPAQALFMKDNACEYLQGFLFSKPVPAIEFTQLLSES